MRTSWQTWPVIVSVCPARARGQVRDWVGCGQSNANLSPLGALRAGGSSAGGERLPFGNDGSPEVVHLAVDADVNLVQMPAPMGVGSHLVDPLPRISGANIGPNRFHHSRTVSWQMSMSRSASRSSTFRSDSGYFTYISTTRRITSGELSNQRNGLVDLAMPGAWLGASYRAAKVWADRTIQEPPVHGRHFGTGLPFCRTRFYG